MKRKIGLIVLIMMISITMVACTKEEEKNTPVVGGWEIVQASQVNTMDENTIKYFETAKKEYKELELELINVLGEQVVAGKNYMYLAKGYKKGKEADATYKIVVVYKDLEGNVSLTSVKDFDFSAYTNTDVVDKSKDVTGGWEVEIPGKPIMLEEKLQAMFDATTEKAEGITYYPIAVLGKQLVSGTNYAVLSYGRPDEGREGIYVLTLYEDLQGNQEMVSASYVDLGEYNK